MSLSRKTALAGVYRASGPLCAQQEHVPDHGRERARRARRRGLTIKDVDGVCTTGIGMSGMGVVGFCDYLNLTPNFVDSTSIGGSSFVAHTAHAAAAIAAGLCKVAVVVYGSTAASQRFAIGTGGGGGGSDPCDQYEVPFGPTTVGRLRDDGAAPHARLRHNAEQLAEIAVTMRLHASMNPAAKYRDPITVEDVLASRDHFLAAASARLLHHQRRRRRAGGDLGRARARPQEEAGLHPRMRARPCAIRRAAGATSWRWPPSQSGPPRLRARRRRSQKTSTWR